MMDIFGPVAALGGLAGGVFNTAMDIENRDYTRKQTEVVRQREDTAVQRRVADLKAAGLSPTLAAGSAASTSSPIKSDAPEFRAPDIMKGLEYENAKKQGAMTEAQTAKLKMDTLAADAARNKSLMDTQLAEANRDAVRANSLLARLLQSGVESAAIGGDEGKILATALFNKTLQEALASQRSGEDIIRNSDMAREKNLPTNDAEAMRAYNMAKVVGDSSPFFGTGQSNTLATIFGLLKAAGSLFK